jgi:hypothetical protein
MAELSSPTTTFPLVGDDLTNLVMQRLRTNPLTYLTVAPVIAQFCGIRLEPIGTWFVDPTAKPLGGIMTLKLWYFQQQTGLACPEIDGAMAASPYGAAVGKLLAYGVINIAEARTLCGGVKDGAVLRAARGGRVMSPKLTLAKLQKQYNADLQAAVETLQEELDKHRFATPQVDLMPASAATATPTSPPQPERQTEPPSEPLVDISREEMIELIVARLGLTPETVREQVAAFVAQTVPAQQGAPSALMQHELIRSMAGTLTRAYTDATFALEVLTPEEQALLRRLVGEDTLFNLKNTLAALSGSRAHQLTQGA